MVIRVNYLVADDAHRLIGRVVAVDYGRATVLPDGVPEFRLFGTVLCGLDSIRVLIPSLSPGSRVCPASLAFDRSPARWGVVSGVRSRIGGQPTSALVRWSGGGSLWTPAADLRELDVDQLIALQAV